MLRKVFSSALAFRERRMFVILGDNPCKTAVEILLNYVEVLGSHEISILYALNDLSNKEASSRLRRFRDGIRSILDFGAVMEIIEYEDTRRVMGTTWDILILDLFDELRPNDIGRLVETVSGGGLIIIFAPPISKWTKTVTEFQRRLLTYPHTEEELKHRFIVRFIRKLTEHDGIWIIDLEKETVHGSDSKPKLDLAKTIVIPSSSLFSKKLYELAKSQDQIGVLRLIEGMIEIVDRKKVLVLTANRGRGKSAIIGLGLAGVVNEWRKLGLRRRVIVTAPELLNVKVLFEFLVKGLEALGLKYNCVWSEGCITRVEVGKVMVRFMKPYDVLAKKRDMTVVDEAAGIPVPMLFRILKVSDRAIFSSTIHGYEGAGRGFSIRFLKSLREHKNIELKTYQMTEPIRYAENDPIEKWLYDVLLLDAEPAELTEEEKKLKVADVAEYYKPDLNAWFSGELEEELRDFIGIYVLAHYRNRPNDLVILADAPHHEARALKLPSNKIVTSIQLTREGPLPKDLILKAALEGEGTPGHLIPNVVLRHYHVREFGKLKGVRIVRIAVHPELMDRGLGSKALKEIEIESRRLKLDWIGSSFGASKRLLNFWLKNDFIPIHISPTRNPVSGEFSVIVVKPISRRAKSIVRKLNNMLKLKLLDTLIDVYFRLEPEVASQILKSGWPVKTIKLSGIQWIRVKMYASGKMVYEATADAVRSIVKKHFLEKSHESIELDDWEEAVLILKCLQGKSWKETAKILDVNTITIKRRLREIIAKIYAYYSEKVKKNEKTKL